MNTQSKLEPPKATVIFAGDLGSLTEHQDMLVAILREYGQDPHATVKVFVSRRQECGTLDWNVRSSSPLTGVVTVDAIQRKAGGNIYFLKGPAMLNNPSGLKNQTPVPKKEWPWQRHLKDDHDHYRTGDGEVRQLQHPGSERAYTLSSKDTAP